jgi:predicted branched-subunit amino acid permease
MAQTTPKSFFWRGFRDAVPFVFVAGPFGVLFGVLATEAGLKVYETMTFTAVVFAGTAQFAALQLMLEDAPTLIVILTALVVNMRVAMYSASLTPYLGQASLGVRSIMAYLTVDQSYALSVVKFEENPKLTLSQRVAYFFGTNGPIAPVWYAATLLGAVMGARIPEAWALDFALPLAFIAMLGPLLRTPAHIAAALISVTVTLGLAWVPYNLSLMIGAVAGMITGAQVELRMRPADD